MCPKVIKRDIKCHAYDPKLAAEGPLWTRFLSEGEFMFSFHLRFQKLIIHFLLEFLMKQFHITTAPPNRVEQVTSKEIL